MPDAVSGNADQGNKLPPIEVVEDDSRAGQQPVQQSQTNGQQGYEYPDEDEDDAGQGGDSRTGAVAGGGQTAQQQADESQTSQQDLTARQRRRQRERQARNAERAELIQLRQQVAQLQGRFDQQDERLASTEVATIESRIAAVEADISRAATVMNRAMAAQNADDFTQAMTIRDSLRDTLAGLRAEKAQHPAAADKDQGTGRQQQADPRALSNQQIQFARIFATRHPWYKHGSADQDSQMVVQIDNEMTAQGLNPSTPEYWMELERRVREDLPQKFRAAATTQDNQGGDQGQQRQNGNGQNGSGNPKRQGGPKLPGGNGSSGNAGGGPVKFHISAERKKALIDLGVWDIPEQRDKHIRRFMEWDKANPAK